MNNDHKNILIVLLVVAVAGLLGVAYFNTDNRTLAPFPGELSSEDGLEEAQQVGGGTDTQSSNSPVPSSVSSQPIFQSKSLDGIIEVTYTDTGFSPLVVTINAGDSIRFVNASSKPMWVTSNNHPIAKDQYYPGFNQSRSVSTGGTYTFSFTLVGLWSYKNLNNENHLGAVSVVEQYFGR